MHYHKFPNLGEIIQGNLLIKLQKGLESKYFVNRYYKCNSTMKVNGLFAYKRKCRKCCVIYKVTCKCCGGFYIVNNQNNLQKELNNT